MVKNCQYRGCNRPVLKEDKVSANNVFYDYCSLYCYEAMKRGMRPIKRKDGAGRVSISSPDIKNECYMCRTIYILKHCKLDANQRFCSRDCYNQLRTYKKGHRDFLLLCILSERGRSMTAEELSKTSSTFQHHLSPIGVGLAMKAWCGRGVVTKEFHKPVFHYTFNSPLLPGELVAKHCRKRV